MVKKKTLIIALIITIILEAVIVIPTTFLVNRKINGSTGTESNKTVTEENVSKELLVGKWKMVTGLGFNSYAIWEFTDEGVMKVTEYEDLECTTVENEQSVEYELKGNELALKHGDETIATEYAVLGEKRKVFVYKKPGEDDFAVLVKEDE